MKNKSKENPTCTGRSVKQTLRFLLCIALLLAAPKVGAQEVWKGEVDTKWYNDGPDPSDGAYHIKTAADLAGLAQLVNDRKDFFEKTVKLDADIVLNDTYGWEDWDENVQGLKEWTPIGNNEKGSDYLRFDGTFDGQGHIVKGVYVDEGSDAGLFGFIGSIGEIRNVGVVESYIKGDRAGGIVGRNQGTIQSCYYTGMVEGSLDAGGILGEHLGLVENCYYYSTNEDLLGIGINKGIGDAEKKPEDSFHNGEVAYLLNNDEFAWGQNLNTPDSYPTALDGNNAVYGITFNYTNKDGDEKHLLVCGNTGQPVTPPTDLPTKYGHKFVWNSEIPETFQKNLEINGELVLDPDVIDITWYKEDANPKEFTIATAAQLRGVSWLTNNVSNLDFKDWTLRLGANIELNNTEKWEQWNETTQNLDEWTPIGTYDSFFQGFFDGQGHIVKGMYVKEGEMVGLFGCFAGTIRNIGVVESYINGSFAGGIVGMNVGTIQSCYYTGMVENGVAGGIAGANQDGTVANCYYYSTKEGLHGIGNEPNHPEVTQIEDKAAFHNGEVAYLLNAWTGQGEIDWGQKLSGTDANLYPTAQKQDGSNAVYKVAFNYPTDGQGPEDVFTGETAFYGNMGDKLNESVELPKRDGYTAKWDPEIPSEFKADETIKAKYEKLYTITIICEPKESTVTADMKEATAGKIVTLTIAPAEGYELVLLTVNNESNDLEAVGDNVYNFKMPAEDVTVTATFEKIEYAITVDDKIVGGSVTVDKNAATINDKITLTITPAEGYDLSTLKVNDGSVDLAAVVDNKYTFVMPAAAVTITAEFKEKETDPDPAPSYVTLHFEPNDSVRLEAESEYIEEGGTFVFTATVAEGYDPATLLVEYRKNPYLSWSPLKPAADGSYRLSRVYSDAYVRASVRPMTPTGIDAITGTQVYTESGTLVVRTAARARVTIVSLFGTTLYAREQEGTERYTDLTSGVYIVRVGDHTYKVRVR